MVENEIDKKCFHKLKIATIFCFVIKIIQMIYSVLIIFFLFRVDSRKYSENMQRLGATVNIGQLKVWEIIYLVLFIVVAVLIFLAIKEIIKGKLPSKWSYYLYILGHIAQVLFMLLEQNFALIEILWNFILAIPAILAVYYLFEMKGEEDLVD
ncbi:MAG: hypothetical protein LBT69_05740 [Lactobacillales bacterium]|jgi:hypothetical protein|nr:hypothetical protein [Lactobacillales bacterium]